jgi:hypothetical protein
MEPSLKHLVTATGNEQAPIHNVIGRAIVDACVKAGKEGRKFRVIIIIPAIPGFAGDLREDAAIGTRYNKSMIFRNNVDFKQSHYGLPIQINSSWRTFYL